MGSKFPKSPKKDKENAKNQWSNRPMALRTSAGNNAVAHAVVVAVGDVQAAGASAAKCHPIFLKDF